MDLEDLEYVLGSLKLLGSEQQEHRQAFLSCLTEIRRPLTRLIL